MRCARSSPTRCNSSVELTKSVNRSVTGVLIAAHRRPLGPRSHTTGRSGAGTSRMSPSARAPRDGRPSRGAPVEPVRRVSARTLFHFLLQCALIRDKLLGFEDFIRLSLDELSALQTV